MKKVAIIGTAGVPGKYGGFETLAHQLVKNLNEEFDLHVYCSNKYYKKQDRVKTWNGAKLHYLPFNANGIQSIIYDFISILHALFYADTLIVLGVSGGVLFPLVKLLTRKKIIVNIDGLEWRRAKWGRIGKRFLKLSEYLAVKYSDADITDNAIIQRYAAKTYKTLSHLIEYGGDHVSKKTAKFEQDIDAYPFLYHAYAVGICRIEPENNVHLILEAFSKMNDKHLVFIGNWNHSQYGKELRRKYRSFKNLHLMSAIYDQDKLDRIRSGAYLYVHGHSAGGTNPSLVEAMNLELPVAAFNVSYNKETTEYKAFYFKHEQDLVDIITGKGFLDYLLNKNKMYEIAKRRYKWKVIAKKYANLIYSFDYAYSKPAVEMEIVKMNSELLMRKGMAHLTNMTPFYEELNKQ